MTTEEMVQTLSRELIPVRPLRRPAVRAALWILVAALCVAVGTFLLGARSDLLSRIRDPQFLLQNGLLLALFAICGRIAFELSVPGTPVAVPVLPFWGLLVWAFMLTDAQSAFAAAGSSAAGWRCVLRMAALALLPAGAAFAMLRRAAPLSPGWTGWLALLSSVSIATAGMQMVCARDDLQHIYRWHFLPAIACAFAGAHLGRWLLSRTSPPRIPNG